jgi:predicted membrane metal-binding protein
MLGIQLSEKVMDGFNAFSIFFPFSFIIHTCIQGLVHFSPLPPPPPLPPTPPPPFPPPIPSRNYFALISNFVVERV